MLGCYDATWWTLRRRWQHARNRLPSYSLADLVAAYCTAFRGRIRSRKLWVRGLNAKFTQPDDWPARASWRKHRRKWKRAYRRAGRFLRGRIPDPCDGPTTHLGGPMDDPRAVRAGWQRAECGNTGNQRFWIEP